MQMAIPDHMGKSTRTLDLQQPGKPPSCLQQPNQKAACYKAKLQEGHHLTETLVFILSSDPEEAKGSMFTSCGRQQPELAVVSLAISLPESACMPPSI